MLTDAEIARLIEEPKVIVKRTPMKGYQEAAGHRRCDLEMASTPPNSDVFTVFIRQNTTFIENFSIGLRYHTGDPALGTVTLIRYNGPHGEMTAHPDGHYAKPHIHRVTAAELASGSTQPPEKWREITEQYTTYEEALSRFFADLAVSNHGDFFPKLGQPPLF